VRLAIQKHWLSVVAVLGIAVIAVAVAVYILAQQGVRFPLVEAGTKRVEIELQNAQAVQPGQGQTVRVAGVEVGRISGVKVENGVAVVDAQIEPQYKNLIREDATALLRPKTPLKDMFIEVTPGTGRVLESGGHIRAANTLPDVNPDEIYSALDADTRPYLKLLVVGAGDGLRGRGDDLREAFERLGPIHRDLARVARAAAERRHELKRLVHRYGVLMAEVGRHPEDLRRLVSASSSVFGALAGENQSISTSVARLPGALRASERALGQVETFAPALRGALQALRSPIRKLDATNRALTPFFQRTTPVIRDQIRPFVRAARPFTSDLNVAARGLAKATPDLTTSVQELNRFFNMGAYNPNGAESLAGKTVAQQRARQEGLLYWLAWTSQNGNSLFSTADAQGPWRRVTLCGVQPALLNSIIASILSTVNSQNPGLLDPLLGSTDGSIAPGSPIANVLATGFGSCNFNSLPVAP
jgi:phospholipid/cholesterol/gamma-HCH transport system substrate-binding protein